MGATALAEGIAGVLGTIIGVQPMFMTAAIITTLTGVTAIPTMRNVSLQVNRRLSVAQNLAPENL